MPWIDPLGDGPWTGLGPGPGLGWAEVGRPALPSGRRQAFLCLLFGMLLLPVKFSEIRPYLQHSLSTKTRGICQRIMHYAYV